jgi:hypothetical protein
LVEVVLVAVALCKPPETISVLAVQVVVVGLALIASMLLGNLPDQKHIRLAHNRLAAEKQQAAAPLLVVKAAPEAIRHSLSMASRLQPMVAVPVLAVNSLPCPAAAAALVLIVRAATDRLRRLEPQAQMAAWLPRQAALPIPDCLAVRPAATASTATPLRLHCKILCAVEPAVVPVAVKATTSMAPAALAASAEIKQAAAEAQLAQ